MPEGKQRAGPSVLYRSETLSPAAAAQKARKRVAERSSPGVCPVAQRMLAHFWEAMHSLSILTARDLARTIDLGSRRRLLDIGGGSGAYDIELCRRFPNLSGTVYELPHVATIAAEKIKEAGLSDRIETLDGDFFADRQLPAGHDVALLSMIMHDWDEERDHQILQKVWQALPSGGEVIISELLVDDSKTGPAPAALMSLNMLIETQGGRNYTAAEYAGWLTGLGFEDVRTVRFDAPGANGAVIGRKP